MNTEVNTQLCAKMYAEAKLLHGVLSDVKFSFFGDLFSEQGTQVIAT